MKHFHGYIYITLDQKYQKCYVGQKAISPKKSENYYGSGKLIQRIVEDRGTYFLKKIILGEIFSNTIEDFKKQLDICEIECIYFFRSYGSDGINYDQIYGYNMIKEARSSLGLPKESRE